MSSQATGALEGAGPRGLYWAARSYVGPSRRRLRSTPCELLCKGLLLYNHLLHSRRVRADEVGAIPDPAFRALVERVGARLFTPGSGAALYRCALPYPATAMLTEHLPARKHPLTGEARMFRARVRHEVFFQSEWLYHTDTSAADDALRERLHVAPAAALVDPAGPSAGLPAGAAFSADLARLIEARALIPCGADNLGVEGAAPGAQIT